MFVLQLYVVDSSLRVGSYCKYMQAFSLVCVVPGLQSNSWSRNFSDSGPTRRQSISFFIQGTNMVTKTAKEAA